MKRLIALLYGLVLFSPFVLAQEMKGYFELAGLYGEMKFETKENNAVRILLTIDGKTIADTVAVLEDRKGKISFSIYYDSLKMQMAFNGTKHPNYIAGDVTARNDDLFRANGTWKIITGNDSGSLQLLLPSPTGKYTIGKKIIHLKDVSRRENLSPDTSQVREIIASIWYPASANSVGQTAPYFNDIMFLRGEFSSERSFEKVKALSGHALLNATEKGNEKFPLLIFSPGGGVDASFNTTLLEELSSHGYIVIGIDHTYEGNGLRLENGIIAKYNSANEKDFLGFALKQITQRFKDIEFVINSISTQTQFPKSLVKIMDKQRIGVFGHSRGGLATGEVLLNDSRIKAALNYDGGSLGAPLYAPSSGERIRAPFAWFRRFHPKPDENSLKEMKMTPNESDRNLERIHSRAYSIIQNTSFPTYIITLDNASHMNFTDIPLLNVNGNSNALAQIIRLMRIVRHYTLSFFNCHLKGINCKQISGFSSEFPEVSIQAILK